MINLPNKTLLRVDEVAAYLSLSERTIRAWIKNGDLGAEKFVGTIRIRREAILNCGVKLEIETLTKNDESGSN